MRRWCHPGHGPSTTIGEETRNQIHPGSGSDAYVLLFPSKLVRQEIFAFRPHLPSRMGLTPSLSANVVMIDNVHGGFFGGVTRTVAIDSVLGPRRTIAFVTRSSNGECGRGLRYPKIVRSARFLSCGRQCRHWYLPSSEC